MSGLENIKSYPLSNEDIQKILEPDTKIWTYPEFHTMNRIDDAFDSLGRCVFLFLTKSPTSGHWNCMFRRGDTIEYFSSYGDKPDAERNWLDAEQLEALDEAEPSLTRLLKESGYKVYYNTHPYQSNREDMNTCGRWCVARLICKDLSNLQFYNEVRRGMKANGLKSPDDWVASFTADILGK